MEVQLTVVGCSPAWPNPGGAQSGYLVEDAGRRCCSIVDPACSRGCAQCGGLAARRRDRDHALASRPLGRPRALGLGRACSARRASCAAPELWVPPGGRELLAELGERLGRPQMFEQAFDVHEYDEDDAVHGRGVRGDRRAACPTTSSHAFGFRVSANGTVLAYSGDSGPSERPGRVRPRRRPLRLRGDPRGRRRASGKARRGATSRRVKPRASSVAAGAKRLLLTHRPTSDRSTAGFEQADDGLVVEV